MNPKKLYFILSTIIVVLLVIIVVMAMDRDEQKYETSKSLTSLNNNESIDKNVVEQKSETITKTAEPMDKEADTEW